MHADTLGPAAHARVRAARPAQACVPDLRRGVTRASLRSDGPPSPFLQVCRAETCAPWLELAPQGHVGCLALHRGRLILCTDDGLQATLHFYDLPQRACVQRIGGMRKYHAPSAFCYFGYDSAAWVHDSTLCVIAFTQEDGDAAA